MSRAPYSVPRGPQMPKAGNLTAWDTCLGWRYPNPRMEAMFALEAMGCTAENIVDQMDISRADQDAFALGSQQKALAAWEAGHFKDEIVPVEAPAGRRKTVLIDRDEGPRADLASVAKLRPAFEPGFGLSNSSTLNDGASALLIAAWAGQGARSGRWRARAPCFGGVDPRSWVLVPSRRPGRPCHGRSFVGGSRPD